MSFRGAASVAALTVLAPFLVACGGGSENASEPLPTTAPTLTVPGDSKTPDVETAASGSNSTDTETTTSTTPATTQSTTTTAPATPQGGTAAPQTGGATPDSPQSDQQPAGGTPASKFEQFCKDNPGAC